MDKAGIIIIVIRVLKEEEEATCLDHSLGQSWSSISKSLLAPI